MIRGGREGYDRLLVLAKDRWRDTSALFRGQELAPAWAALTSGAEAER